MPSSDISGGLKVALQAMPLVERGAGEMPAIRKIISQNPTLRAYRDEGRDVLLGALAERDLLDRISTLALSDPEMGPLDRSLVRLAIYAILNCAPFEMQKVMLVLRGVASGETRRRVEYLFGFLQTLEEDQMLTELSDIERTALRTHNPTWWVQYCYRVFGRTGALHLLIPTSRPRYARVNTLRNRGRRTLPPSLESLADKLEKVEGVEGIFAVSGSLSQFAEQFETGLFQVQDLASFLAVSASNPVPGEKVLDLCAAPGAKTATLAQFMKNRGRIISVDYSLRRMADWRRETSRLRVKIGSPLVADASALSVRGLFDLVLLDPPCSGTGILDNNPRMKWRLSRKLVEKCSQLQGKILAEAASVTRPGGRILYCTCSITVEENENVVSEFLRNNPGFELVPCLSSFGSEGIGLREARRFFPHRDKTAGYFVARIQHSQ